MSLSALRNYATRSALVARYDAAEADQTIQDFLQGCYDAAPAKAWEINEAWLTQWDALPDHKSRVNALQGKSTLSRLMAWEWHRTRQHKERPTFPELLKKAFKQRHVLRWMRQNEALCKEIKVWEHRPFPESLTNLGIDGPVTAQRFSDLYREVHDPNRVWKSSHQVDRSRVRDIALCREYTRLPLWVKKGLMNAPESAQIGGDRVGNIWRLPDCVKAWKWAALPKRIAEKIGKCSPRMRMLAAIAWYSDCENPTGDKVCDFWNKLWRLERMSLREQCELALSNCGDRDYCGFQPVWGKVRFEAFLSESIGLPMGVIELPKKVSMKAIEEAILKHGSPKVVCESLLGCSGKATVKAFQKSKPDAWRWAGAIAFGDANAVQKILSMTTLIEWEPDAVNFLLSLPMVSRLRMLQATTFKYRGEVQPISPDHVRDTGYLWDNIENKPNLGRVRCWFSVHERLAAAFVEELPDEDLPIPQGWEHVDGLCSVNGEWEIELPKCVATLKYYGQILSNCVGGYGPAIKSGRSVVFVVREYGKITHCVEFSNGSWNQFYKARNSSPDPDIKESVLAALEQAGLA